MTLCSPFSVYSEYADSRTMSDVVVINQNCNCPKTECLRHGNCNDCVEFHKAEGKKIPFCLRFMVGQ